MLILTLDLVTLSDIWTTTIQVRLVYHILLTVILFRTILLRVILGIIIFFDHHSAMGHSAECHFVNHNSVMCLSALRYSYDCHSTIGHSAECHFVN